MKLSQILALSIGGTLAVIAGVGTIVANANQGVIDGYLSDTDFGFAGEAFQKAAAASDELCQALAEGGVAMLRNERNTLPYNTKKINLFGWNATDNGFFLRGIGSGSSAIKDTKAVTLVRAFEEEGWEVNQDLLDFYKDFNNTSLSYGGANNARTLINPGKELYDEALLDDAVAFSNQAAIVISRVCGENVGEIPVNQTRYSYGLDNSRSYLSLSQQEEELLDLVCSRFDKVTVIINSSNTMELGALELYDVGACLNIGLPGQSGALAIPRILEGKVNPSGRVADTFAYDTRFDTPSFKTYQATNSSIGYFEGVYVGYRWYETADAMGFWNGIDNDYGRDYEGVVQYPFGFGLSYTTFEWTYNGAKDSKGEAISDWAEITPEELVTLSFDCKNTGEVAGADVIQVYGHAPWRGDDAEYDSDHPALEKPSLQLLDFAKTGEIDPGITQRGIEISFRMYDLASYDCYDRNNNGFAGYELEKGDYAITFNENAHEVRHVNGVEDKGITFTYDDDRKIENDPVTGKPVENHFTGDSAYGGIQLDGSDGLNTAPVYLSRMDGFASIDSLHAAGAINNKARDAGTFENHSYDQDEMPETGADNGRLIMENGVWNEELVDAIGDDYDSDILTELVDQLTIEELKKNVESSGFGTPKMDSVGKPECFDFDGPAGFNQNTVKANRDNGEWTAFPAEVLIGQSFDKDLAYQMGVSVANEGKATGLNGWYAPGVNIHRTPYSGRNYEYYSEDPILSGKMAAEVILGAKNHGLYCYIKHFTMAEEGPNPRNVHTFTSEQAYREIYLRPFEISVKEGKTVAIMSGFNNIATIWCGSNYAQNVSVLREEWGFRGTMVTDWSNGDSVMNPTRGIRAGNDIWLNPNPTNGAPLNMSDPTTVYCAKMAARNVLWTYINTHYTMMHYDTSLDTVSINIGTVTTEKKTFPWKAIVYSVDGVIWGGAAIWIGLAFLLPVMAKKKVSAE